MATVKSDVVVGGPISKDDYFVICKLGTDSTNSNKLYVLTGASFNYAGTANDNSAGYMSPNYAMYWYEGEFYRYLQGYRAVASDFRVMPYFKFDVNTNGLIIKLYQDTNGTPIKTVNNSIPNPALSIRNNIPSGGNYYYYTIDNNAIIPYSNITYYDDTTLNPSLSQPYLYSGITYRFGTFTRYFNELFYDANSVLTGDDNPIGRLSYNGLPIGYAGPTSHTLNSNTASAVFFLPVKYFDSNDCSTIIDQLLYSKCPAASVEGGHDNEVWYKNYCTFNIKTGLTVSQHCIDTLGEIPYYSSVCGSSTATSSSSNLFTAGPALISRYSAPKDGLYCQRISKGGIFKSTSTNVNSKYYNFEEFCENGKYCSQDYCNANYPGIDCNADYCQNNGLCPTCPSIDSQYCQDNGLCDNCIPCSPCLPEDICTKTVCDNLYPCDCPTCPDCPNCPTCQVCPTCPSITSGCTETYCNSQYPLTQAKCETAFPNSSGLLMWILILSGIFLFLLIVVGAGTYKISKDKGVESCKLSKSLESTNIPENIK